MTSAVRQPMYDAKKYVNIDNIPYELRDFERWAFATTKKVPLRCSAVVTGNWLGADHTDQNTLCSFPDMAKMFSISPPSITCPAVGISAEMGLVFVDLDDVHAKVNMLMEQTASNPDPLTAEKARQIEAAWTDIQYKILNVLGAKGAYVEKSLSGNGYHILFRGEAKHKAYALGGFDDSRKGLHGNIYSSGQFMYITGNCQNTLPDGATQGWQGKLPDLTQTWSDLEDELLALGAMRPQASSEITGKGDIDRIGTDYQAHGRRLGLDDQLILWQLYMTEKTWGKEYNSWSAYNAGAGATGDWSEDTKTLIGDLDKLTASGAQIRRIMESSPRMINAGHDSSGHDRWDKVFGRGASDYFERALMKTRQNNDQWFENGGKALFQGTTPEGVEARTANGNRVAELLTKERLEREAEAERQAKLDLEEAKRLYQEQIIAEKSTLDVAQVSVPKFGSAEREELNKPLMDIEFPPGKLGALAKEFDDCSMYPNRIQSVMTAFHCVSALGLRVYSIDGLGMGIYSIYAAHSTTGKDMARRHHDSFLRALGELDAPKDDEYTDETETPRDLRALYPAISEVADFTSPQVMSRHMSQYAACSTYLPERAAFLKSVNSREGSDQDWAGTLASLKTDGDNDNIRGAKVASTSGHEHGKVRLPSLSIILEVQPEMLYDTWAGGGVAQGLYNRVLIIDGSRKAKPLAVRDHPKTLDMSVISQFRGLAGVTLSRFTDYTLATAKGEREYFGHNPTEKPNLVNVKMDDESRAASLALLRDVDERSDFENNQLYTLLYGRMPAMVKTYAALMAIANNPMNPIVTMIEFQYAAKYVTNALSHIHRKIETGGVGLDEARRLGDIRAVLKAYHTYSQASNVSREAQSVGIFGLTFLTQRLRRKSSFDDAANGSRARSQKIYDTLMTMVSYGEVELIQDPRINKEVPPAFANLNLRRGVYFRILELQD